MSSRAKRHARRHGANAKYDDPGNSIADFSMGALAFMLAGALTVLVTARVDETELVAAAGVVSTLALRFVAWGAAWWFKANDGRIDAFERYWLYILGFLVWTGYYFTTAAVLVLFYDMTRGWPLPRLSEMVLYLAMALVALVALVPRFSALVTVAAPARGKKRDET